MDPIFDQIAKKNGYVASKNVMTFANTNEIQPTKLNVIEKPTGSNITTNTFNPQQTGKVQDATAVISTKARPEDILDRYIRESNIKTPVVPTKTQGEILTSPIAIAKQPTESGRILGSAEIQPTIKTKTIIPTSDQGLFDSMAIRNNFKVSGVDQTLPPTYTSEKTIPFITRPLENIKSIIDYIAPGLTGDSGLIASLTRAITKKDPTELGAYTTFINKNFRDQFIPTLEDTPEMSQQKRMNFILSFTGGGPETKGSTSSGKIGKLKGLETPESLPNKLPAIDQELSYKPTMTENIIPVKERGFITSLKENPKTSQVFKDIVDEYPVFTDERALKEAKDFIDKSPEEALKEAFDQNLFNKRTNAVRLELIDRYARAGDWEKVKELGSFTAKETTEAAQGLQALSMLGTDLDTPAKAIITAEQQFNNANKKVFPKFENKVKTVQQEFETINNNATEQVLKELENYTPATPKIELPIGLEERISKQQVSPAEILASRIRTPTDIIKAPDPIKEMINTLYKLAQEQLPERAKKVPKNEIELIGQAVRDKETYKDIWLKAQELVREHYKGKEKELAQLDKYFGTTLLSGKATHATLPIAERQVQKALQQEIKKQQINLRNIVRQHYSVKDTTGRSLTEKLVKDANISFKDAVELTKVIQNKFYELTNAKKESILKSMFREKVVSKDKGFINKIIELSNLGAFDKIELRNQLANKLGLVTLTDDIAKQLSNQTQLIQRLPFGYERFKQTQVLLRIMSDNMPVSKSEILGNVLNIPRTLMSSFFDLSFGFRQGLFSLYGHPKEFSAAFKSQFKQFALEKEYEKAMDLVMKNPDFQLAEKAGVHFTDVGSTMGRREEKFMSSFAEKIPLLGKGVRMTSRAYTGMANKLRMDIFSSMIKDAERLGYNPSIDQNLLENIAEYINNATGRGSLGKGKLESSAALLNAIFFSPRLMASRINLLNPVYYYKAEPFVRKQALKTLFTMAGASMTILGLAELAGADVTIDPRNSDFGKIKIGNTRIDILGGFQQYIRMAAQLITGKYVSSTTGKEYTLGEGYKPLTRFDIILRQLESKESPIASFITDLLRGQDYAGNKVKVTDEIIRRITPMIISDLMDLYNDDPSLMPLGLLGIFGIGVQTYGPKQSTGGINLPNVDIPNINIPNVNMPNIEIPNITIN